MANPVRPDKKENHKKPLERRKIQGKKRKIFVHNEGENNHEHNFDIAIRIQDPRISTFPDGLKKKFGEFAGRANTGGQWGGNQSPQISGASARCRSVHAWQ